MKKILLIIFLALIIPHYAVCEDLTEDLQMQPVYVEDSSLPSEVQVNLKQKIENNEESEDILLPEDVIENEYAPSVNFNSADSTPTVINLKTPQPIKAKSFKEYKIGNVQTVDPTRYLRTSKYSTQEYSIAPLTSGVVKKSGKFSYGTIFSSEIDTAQLENSTKVFTRYETEKYAFSTTFSKTEATNYGGTRSSLYLAPELKLGKGFSIKDVMRGDIETTKKKNEIVLIYKPPSLANTNSLQFEIGAGQSFYENADSRSTFRFSTSFKL